MGFWISECDGVRELSGGDSTRRFFECTPRYALGVKQGVVKVGDGGTELRSFSVEVVTAPVVSAVSPLAATLDVTTAFTVTGSNLPSGLAFWIDECTGVTELAGGTATSRQFQCTPSYSTGTKQGLVKVAQAGPTLRSFNVEVASSAVYQNVSPWAQEAAAYMVENGIVEDPPNHDLRGTSEANRAEVATMIYRALGGGKNAADANFAAWHGGELLPLFADAADPGAWYFKPVTYLGMLAYANDAAGVTAFDQQPCIFRPAQSISRAWVLKALLEAWKRTPLASVSEVPLFDDVAPSHPAAGYVYLARQLGVAEGTNNRYRPNDWTNREDLFVLLHRILDPSVNPLAPAKPVPSAVDFYDVGRCSEIGHRYEQPVLRGVQPPTVDVSATIPQREDIGILKDVYASTLEALISGLDPGEYVDANGVTHRASAFCAWAADGGTFIDLDPGSPEPFCRVKWLAPVDFIDGAVFTVTLYVGDGLGSEVRRTVTLALAGASPDTTAPSVTIAPLPSGLVGGEPMEITGTVADHVDAASADYGVLAVKLWYSLDGGASWLELGPAELLAGNAWRYRWLMPRLAGSVRIRAVATNLLGNHAEAARTTTIGTLLTIEGTVVDSFGQPVENARAVLSGGGLGAESLADNLGSVRFTSLGDGLVAGTSYTLTASFDGRTAARSGLVLSAASPTLFPVLTLDTSPPVTAASPEGGTYSSAQSVELSCSDDRSGCAATHYTTDGTLPTTSSSVYSGPIDIADTTLHFFSVDQSGNAEPARSEIYTLGDPPPPTNGYVLTVVKQGDGDGTVSGGGIDCGPGCSTSSVSIEEGTSVTLTGSGDQFIGFMGDTCYGTEPCSFGMFRDLTVHASFALPGSLGVSFTAPANGDAGVGTSTYPTIYFNRDVQPGPNFGGIELRLSDGTPVPFTAVIGHPDSRLTIVRDSSLTRGQTYEVVIPAGAVSDQQGTPLAALYSFAFTVEEEGMPKMYVSVYPHHVMEGREAKVTVWFESPFDEARWIEFSSNPDGQLIHPSGMTLDAGEFFVEIDVDTRLNHGSLSDFTETFQVTDADAGTESVQIIVVNDTPQSSNLKWQGSAIVDDADGDGVFEANESAEIEFFVANFGSSTIFNVVLEFQVANTFNMSILGGSPYTCTLGAIGAGSSRSCTRSFRADDDLPTGDYYIKVHATSSGSDQMRENALVHVVNNSQPDFVLNAQAFTDSELPPGSRQEVRYTARNNGDGFSLGLPIFEVFMEIEGQEELLYRTFAEVRGDVMHEQSFELPFTVPATPGTYPIRARINPPGTEQRPESNFANNDATEITLRVAAPNQPPQLGPIGGPFFVNVGSPLDFTVSATDPNGDPVTFRLGPGAPAGMTIGSQSGRITWTPACGQGSQTITVIAEDPDLAADSETVSMVVGVQADLSVSKTASTALAVPGQGIGFTVVVTNHGPSCLSAATVSDAFGVDLVDVTWTCSASSGSSCSSAGSGVLNDSSVALQSDGTVTYEITARIADDAAGSILNEASAFVPSGATDPNGGNNAAAVFVTLSEPAADLSLAKDDDQDPVLPGTPLTYTLTVSNLGPSASTGGQVTDVLPAALAFTSSPNGCSAVGQTVTCPFGPLAAGAAVSLRFTVAVDPDAAAPIVNTASVTGNEDDPVAANDGALESSSLVDFPPTVTRVDTVPGTGDGELEACESARVAVTKVLVTFSEAIQDPPGDSDPDDVTYPDNYLLLGAGPDQDFATDLCGTLFGDDEPVALDGVTWNGATHTATLALADGEPLPDGAYRLLICGSTSLYDLVGNSLDGDGDGTGGDDFLLTFRVDAANAFANGRLDCGLDSWIVATTHPGEIVHGDKDASGASISGSAHVTNLTASDDFSLVQCVPSGAGVLRELSARVRFAASPGVTVSLSGACEHFAQAACGGASLGVAQEVVALADTAGQWIGFAGRATAPEGSVSAMCGYSLSTAGESFDAYLDDLVLRDVCTGDDSDGDGVCADSDCDDDDPAAAVIDPCGVCGGDGSTCATIFEDGFESGDTSAWSTTAE